MSPLGVPVTRERYKAFLLERRGALNRLCEAAKDYLCVQIDEELKALDELPTSEPSEVAVDRTAQLVEAQAAVERLESQIATLQEAIDQAPEPLGSYMESMGLPLLQEQLRNATHQRDWFQKALEKEQMEAEKSG